MAIITPGGLVIPDGATPMPSRRDVASMLKQEMRAFMISTVGNAKQHAEAVAAGRTNFRIAFAHQWAAFYNGNRNQCDELANTIFQGLEVLWRKFHPRSRRRSGSTGMRLPARRQSERSKTRGRWRSARATRRCASTGKGQPAIGRGTISEPSRCDRR